MFVSLYGDGTTKFRPSTIASTISWSVLWFSYMMVFLFCIWLDANRGFSSHHNSCNHDAKQKHISFYLVCCTEFAWNSRFCGLLRHFCSFICVRQFEFPFNQKWSEFCVCFFFRQIFHTNHNQQLPAINVLMRKSLNLHLGFVKSQNL